MPADNWWKGYLIQFSNAVCAFTSMPPWLMIKCLDVLIGLIIITVKTLLISWFMTAALVKP